MVKERAIAVQDAWPAALGPLQVKTQSLQVKTQSPLSEPQKGQALCSHLQNCIPLPNPDPPHTQSLQNTIQCTERNGTESQPANQIYF